MQLTFSADSYSNEGGSLYCNLCGSGSFSSKNASTSCKQCDAGFFSAANASVNCTPCSPGTNCRSVDVFLLLMLLCDFMMTVTLATSSQKQLSAVTGEQCNVWCPV